MDAKCCGLNLQGEKKKYHLQKEVIRNLLMENILMQRLTGGIVLSRDREFIVFYRGKDFLPPSISKVIEERRNNVVGQNNTSSSSPSEKSFISSEPSMENAVHDAQKKRVSLEGETKNTKSTKTISVKLSKVFFQISQIYRSSPYIRNVCKQTCMNSVISGIRT